MEPDLVDNLTTNFERLGLEPVVNSDQARTNTDPIRTNRKRRTGRMVCSSADWSPRIKCYGEGYIEVPGLGAGADIKLYPGGGRFWDWSETKTKLETGIVVGDVEELVQHGATMIIISLGMENELRVDPAVLRYLAERNIPVIMARTYEATRLYCRLVEHWVGLAALFISYPGKPEKSVPWTTVPYLDEQEL